MYFSKRARAGNFPAARERHGLTQAQLAERLDETQSTVSKCERGDKRLDIVEVVAFCRAIGIPFSQFAAELERLIEEERSRKP